MNFKSVGQIRGVLRAFLNYFNMIKIADKILYLYFFIALVQIVVMKHKFSSKNSKKLFNYSNTACIQYFAWIYF